MVGQDNPRYVGFDLGGTEAKLWLEGCGGSIPPLKYEGEFQKLPQLSLEVIADFLIAQLTIHNPQRQVAGIGLALACTMVSRKGDSGSVPARQIPPNSTKFSQLTAPVPELEVRLSKRCDTTVCILNDGEAAAMSAYELARTPGRGWKNVLVVTLGTSVGVGFVFDGRPFIGPYTSRASHILLDPEGDWCPGESHRGCWKTLAGHKARLKLAGDMGLSDRQGPWDSKMIAEKVTDHNYRDRVELFFDFYAERVARGIATIVGLVPVDCIIIAGGVSKAGDLLLQPLIARLRKGDILDRSVAEYLAIECQPEAAAAHGAAIFARRQSDAGK